MSHAKQARAAHGSPGVTPITTAVARGGHVLIASADAIRGRALAAVVCKDGHVVITARAALEFLALAGIAGPDLRHPRAPAVIVIDTVAGDWSGLPLVELAVAAPWHLPVIAIVADAATAARVTALGARAVLREPADPDLLRAEVMLNVSTTLRGAA